MKFLKKFEEQDFIPNNIKLVPVLWNGFYRDYNYELQQLAVGDYTDKGLITKKSIKSTDLRYSTIEGEFRANQFSVYVCDNYKDLQEFIEIKKNQSKYNL